MRSGLDLGMPSKRRLCENRVSHRATHTTCYRSSPPAIFLGTRRGYRAYSVGLVQVSSPSVSNAAFNRPSGILRSSGCFISFSLTFGREMSRRKLTSLSHPRRVKDSSVSLPRVPERNGPGVIRTNLNTACFHYSTQGLSTEWEPIQ
jgi:hypothetical protein